MAEFWLIFDWFLTEFCLHFGCTLAVFWLHFGCILTAFWLHFNCIFIAFWLHFDCIMAEFWLNFSCNLTAKTFLWFIHASNCHVYLPTSLSKGNSNIWGTHTQFYYVGFTLIIHISGARPHSKNDCHYALMYRRPYTKIEPEPYCVVTCYTAVWCTVENSDAKTAQNLLCVTLQLWAFGLRKIAKNRYFSTLCQFKVCCSALYRKASFLGMARCFQAAIFYFFSILERHILLWREKMCVRDICMFFPQKEWLMPILCVFAIRHFSHLAFNEKQGLGRLKK